MWRQPTDVFPGPHSSLGDVLAVEAKLCGSRGSLLQSSIGGPAGAQGEGGAGPFGKRQCGSEHGLSGRGFWKSSRTSSVSKGVVLHRTVRNQMLSSKTACAVVC